MAVPRLVLPLSISLSGYTNLLAGSINSISLPVQLPVLTAKILFLNLILGNLESNLTYYIPIKWIIKRKRVIQF